MRPWKTVEESFIREFANSYSFLLLLLFNRYLSSSLCITVTVLANRVMW